MKSLAHLLIFGFFLACCTTAILGTDVPAPVPSTGQADCWDSWGNLIDCAGTGQDGEHQIGVSVPRRFTDNRDGTVTDNLTGLLWLKSANCFGEQTWADALSMVGELGDGDCGLTDGSAGGDWRLPNLKELESLHSHAGPDGSFPGTHPTGIPFLGLGDDYWSSTSYLLSQDKAWTNRREERKTRDNLVWAVRDRRDLPGRVPSPVLRTGQIYCWATSGAFIDCAGTGHDGDYQSGASVSPRFMDNLDGTVTDNLTDLIWLKNANCFGGTGWARALEYANKLEDGSCGLSDGSAPGEWRLPNIKELQTLIDFGLAYPALPTGHPFTLVKTRLYWSATTYPRWPDNAWGASFSSGYLRRASKTGRQQVWPVRSKEQPIPVKVFVNPWLERSVVDLASRHSIPVAVLGSDTFDATEIDVASLRFGPQGASPVQGIRAGFPQRSFPRDINRDGHDDLVSWFLVHEAGIVCGDDTVELKGETKGGRPFSGSDSIETIHCGARGAGL